MDIKAVRASLKPVGDPDDWENNEDFMHPDNFKIRLFSALDDAKHYIETGNKRGFISSDEFLKEMKELRKEVDQEEVRGDGY
jgi:hypothetical protein